MTKTFNFYVFADTKTPFASIRPEILIKYILFIKNSALNSLHPGFYKGGEAWQYYKE